MNINKKLIKYNFNVGRSGQPIKYIVIHDTGNTSKGAGANNHYLYFNGGNRQASAHYFVDDTQILQVVEDNNTSWHCGDGKGKYGITNSNSIGIEICINSDGNYDKAVDSTIELTKYLMKKYNIPIENVVRHYDASRKICPATMSKNNWAKWHEFKNRLKSETVKVRYKGKDMLVEGILKDDKNYVGIRDLLEQMGYTLDWEQSTQTVVIK